MDFDTQFAPDAEGEADKGFPLGEVTLDFRRIRLTLFRKLGQGDIQGYHRAAF